MEFPVQIERCIFRTVTFADYKNVLEFSGDMNGNGVRLLETVMEQNNEVYLGQIIPASVNCPASLIVVDLIPATSGVLCEETTLIVFPPDSKGEFKDMDKTLNRIEDEYDDNINNNNEYCKVVLDYFISGSTAVASPGFFMRTLLMDRAVVFVGDEEYTTAFVVHMEEQENSEDVDISTLLRTSPDVFRNLRASIFLDSLPTSIIITRTKKLQYSERELYIPFSAFQTIRNNVGLPLTLKTENNKNEFQLSSVIVVPVWPIFMLIALFGDMFEEFLTLALYAFKEDLHERIVSEGDVIILYVTPELFVKRQLVYTDVIEAMLACTVHYVQSGHAMTAMRIYSHEGVIAIPLRVVEIISPSSKSYGILDLSGHGTELHLSLRSRIMYADTTPPFPPPRPLRNFLSTLSFTVNIRNVLNSFLLSSHSSETCVFVVHAIPDNLPYECIITVLLEKGIECLILDLDRWSDEDVRGLFYEYMHSTGEVALVIKNAQCLHDRPHVLQLFNTDTTINNITSTGVHIIFLVCENIEKPPPTVTSIACNMEGVIKGINPSDVDRRLILESQFKEAENLFGIYKSLLLSFDILASWTVGLTVMDLVVYMQECISKLISMKLINGVHPVLSESLCENILQKYQKSHGYNLISTKLQPIRWSDVGGLEEAKRELRETIQLPLMYPDLFYNNNNSNIKRRAGILFYGPPGCGKTLLAKAVATEMNMNFISVKGPELINQYVGESEKNIRLLFQRARDNSPCIIFFDELDALAPARGGKGDGGSAIDRVVAQLLVEVDGVGHMCTDGTISNQIFIIGATNRPDLLDSSLLRPGRFDKLCYLGLPSTREEQLLAIRALTRKFDLADDVDFNILLEPLSFEYTGADLFALCSDAMMFAVESMLDRVIITNGPVVKKENEIGETTRLVVHMCDFIRARNQLKPSVSAEDLRRYEALRSKLTTW